jgi:hypothetical protein
MVSNISDAEYKSQEIFSRFCGGAVQHHGLTYRWTRLHRRWILILCTARRLKCSSTLSRMKIKTRRWPPERSKAICQ